MILNQLDGMVQIYYTHFRNSNAQFFVTMYDDTLEGFVENICDSWANVRKEPHRIANKICWAEYSI